MLDSRTLWQTVLGELEVSVSPAVFATWFKNTSIITCEGTQLSLAVPNIITREWLSNKFETTIIACLNRLDVPITNVTYKIVPLAKHGAQPTASQATKPNPKPQEPAQLARAAFAVSAGATLETPAQAPITRQPKAAPATHQLNPRYTFADFVIGSSNELAYAVSQATAKFPGQKYNPLFLYGGVGLGKTHLMQAIGSAIIAENPDCRLRYITSEQFTNEFIDSLQHKKIKAFSQLYRNLDVLIVDDIQFIGTKERTQEEFFHTFNTLHQAGKQIIMSSDKLPRDIPQLESRLRSRFEMGMLADVQRPDLETRAAIIQRKASQDNLQLPSELVEYLARSYQHNIRELEGALTHLIAYCEVLGIEPSISVAKGLSGAGSVPRRRALNPTRIIETTANYFQLRPADLTGSKRDHDIVVPRQIAMYLLYEELGLSYPKIAGALGKRDHTTAIHSVRKIQRLIEADDEVRSDINHIKERISL